MQAPMTVFVKPEQPGTRVPFPGTREALPAEGASVEYSNYWRERVREGSVVIVEEKFAAPTPTIETSKPARTKKD